MLLTYRLAHTENNWKRKCAMELLNTLAPQVR